MNNYDLDEEHALLLLYQFNTVQVTTTKVKSHEQDSISSSIYLS